MSQPDPQFGEDFNPYAPPRAELGTEPMSKGAALVRAYRWRARAIRGVATVHLALGLWFLVLGLFIMAYNAEAIPALIRDWVGPEGASRYPHNKSPEDFGVGLLFLLLVGAPNSALGVGLWRLRRWPGRLAAAQAWLFLATGISVAIYDVIRYNDFGGVRAVFPGLVLVMLAGFVRSPRSLVVCSQAYRQALAEVSRAGV
jgi:hypothetical protein